MSSTTASPNVTADVRAYDLFLSYNSRDRDDIRAVRQLLAARGVKTFYDRHDLLIGEMWLDKLQNAVASSCAMAVFIGHGGLGTWQKREMALALDQQATAERSGGKFRVIPVLLPQSDVRDAPSLLLLNTWLDLRQRLDDPDALDALARSVLGGAEMPLPAAPLLPPYRDLRAFREEDALLFFGRETFSRELFAKTKENDLVAVVGPSGSGKTSVVQAGLLPLLRREPRPFSGWDAVTFTPGANPFHNLALPLVSLWNKGAERTSLVVEAGELGNSWAGGAPLEVAVGEALGALEGTERLLFVADQFEELFTLTAEKLRRPFVEALLAAARLRQVTVVLTLRADFYGHAITLSRELSDLIQRGLVNLGPMKREELQLSIEQPARHVGLCFESGLVKRILDHVENQPGSLPLLEFALTELWQRRDGALLKNEHYDEIGCVEGAVRRRADEQFRLLASEGERASLLRFLTRLVRVSAAGEEGADTRRRASLRILDEKTREAVESFVRARLLVKGRNEAADDETVEVAHEALIRKWPRLRELLDRDREFLLWRQRLALRLDEYEWMGRDAGALLAGAPLNEARKFLRERPEDLSTDEREYIHVSERAQARPKFWVAAASAATLVVALLAAAIIWAWLNSATHQAALIREDAERQVSKAGPSAVSRWLAALALSGRVDEVLAATKGVREPESRALVLSAIASTLARSGKKDDARRVIEEATRTVQSGQGNLVARALAFVDIARTRLSLGQKDEARQAAAAALDSYEQYYREAGQSKDPPRENFDGWKSVIEVLLKTDQTGAVRAKLKEWLTVSKSERERVGLPRTNHLNLIEYAFRVLIELDKLEDAKSLDDVEDARSLAEAPTYHVESMLVCWRGLARSLKKENRAYDPKWFFDRALVVAIAVKGDGLPEVAELLLEIGEVDAARRVARKFYSYARTAKDKPTYFSLSKRMKAAELLAQVGLLDDALEEINVYVSKKDTIPAYISVIVALDSVGRTDEAKRLTEYVANRVGENTELGFYVRAEPFCRILVDMGRLDLARKFLPNFSGVGSSGSNDVVVPSYINTARSLFDEGKVDEALTIVADSLSKGQEAFSSKLAYKGGADLFAKAGRGGEFRRAVAEAKVGHEKKSLMLVTLAESLIEAGEGGEAKTTVREALVEAAQADNTQKLPLLARAAIVQARLGLLREGQETVKDCSPNDKLKFYSIAVLKYAGLEDDRLVKALEPERSHIKPYDNDNDE